MRRYFLLFQVTVLGGLVAGVVLTPSSHAGDVGYVEDFALARDRAEALKQLIPGTEDYYYYQALNYLNTEQFDKAIALQGPWHQRQMGSPAAFRSGLPHCSAVTTHVRRVLTRGDIGRLPVEL